MFGQKFIEGCCYKISECEVVSSSPSHSGISHKYQLRLNQFSEVTPATPFEPRFMPLLTPLSSLKNLNRKTVFVNVIGVVCDAEDPYMHSASRTNKLMLRRNVKLIDESCQPVWLSLYRNQAGMINDAVMNEKVVLVSEAKIWRYGIDSFNLQVWFEKSRVTVDPTSKRGEELRAWWREEKRNERKRLLISHEVVIPLISTHRNEALPTNTSSFCQIDDDFASRTSGNRVRGEHHEYSYISGVITIVKRENFIYKACPVRLCRKKVTSVNRATSSRDSSSGQGFFCPKCNLTYNRYQYGYALKVFINDFSGGRWATVFNDEAEKLLKRSPDEVLKLRDELSGFDFEHFMNRPLFKRQTFRIKSNIRNFFEEQDVVHTVVSVGEAPHESIANGLMREIGDLESS